MPMIRRLVRRSLFALLVAGWAMGPAVAAEPSAGKAFSPADRQAIEDVVRGYLMEHPEIIIEAIQNLRERQERETRDRARANLVKLRGELLNDPATPVGGNPKGDVTIVEFFDYRCGFCKRVFPDLQEVLKTDGNVRYVFKEFPILGPESTTAAKVALAAWNIDNGRYPALHNDLMKTRGALPESRVMDIAVAAGYDAKALKTAMTDPWIDKVIEKNYALAQALDINGTPAFVIGDEVIRGAIDLAQIRRLITKARGS